MALTQAQINALNGVTNLTPDQSAATLGHSTGLISNLISGYQKNVVDPMQAHSTGFAKQVLGDVQDIGKMVTTPIQMATGDTSKLGIPEETLQKKGTAEKLGALTATGAEMLIPIGGEGTIGQLLAKGEKLPVVGKALSKLGSFLAKKPIETAVEKQVMKASPINIATKRIAASADMLTKNELAQEASRVTTKGTLLPSEIEQRAGELLKGKTYANPTKTLSSIKNEIATRGKEVEQYLGENGKPISNEEDFTMFQQAREKAAKYLTPSQLNGYDHAITQFQSELKGMGNMNTGTYYKALKNFESNVTDNLPKGVEALTSETVSGQLVGAKTVRNVVRDMIGQKNPAFKQKMFDLMSLYDAKGNVAAKVAQMAKQSTTFAKRHPVITKTAKYGAEAVGAGAVYEGAKSVGVSLP